MYNLQAGQNKSGVYIGARRLVSSNRQHLTQRIDTTSCLEATCPDVYVGQTPALLCASNAYALKHAYNRWHLCFGWLPV